MSKDIPVESVRTDLRTPGGHYAHAVRAGGFLFVSGQLAIRPDGAPAVDADVVTQLRMCLSNLERIIKDAGLGLSHIVKTTVYISDVEDWAEVNAAYAHFFGDHRPARSIVPVGALHFGLSVEVEAVARDG